MFESIGFSEMLLIAVIALIVLGPEKFPEYAKIFLRATRDLQGYIQGIREDLAKEVNPLKKEFDSFTKQDPEKLLDALMKAEEKKKEVVTSNSGETYPAASSSDTPQSDADSHPYQQQEVSSETPPQETASQDQIPEHKPEETPAAEPTITGDGAQYAKNDDFFNVKPPEKMD